MARRKPLYEALGADEKDDVARSLARRQQPLRPRGTLSERRPNLTPAGLPASLLSPP